MSQLEIYPENAPRLGKRPLAARPNYARAIRRILMSPWTLALAYVLVEAARTWCATRYPAWAEWLAKLSEVFKPR